MTIPLELEKFLSEHSMNLSRVVQKTISYMMETKTTVLSKDYVLEIFSEGLRIGEVATLNLEDIMENEIFAHSENGKSETIVGLPTTQ